MESYDLQAPASLSQPQLGSLLHWRQVSYLTLHRLRSICLMPVSEVMYSYRLDLEISMALMGSSSTVPWKESRSCD